MIPCSLTNPVIPEEIPASMQDIENMDFAIEQPARPEKPRFLRLMAYTGIDLVVLLGLTVSLMVVVSVVKGPIQLMHRSLAFPTAIMLGIVVIEFGRWFFKRQASNFLFQIPAILRDWIPFLLIDLMYENLHDLAPHIALSDITGFLYDSDVWLFGSSPAVWAQQIHTPLLTDLMSIFYASYLALPLLLMVILTLTQRRELFQQIAIAVIFTFVIGFIGYVLTPALPPRFYVPHLYTDPVQLHGLYVYQLQAVWDQLSAVKGAAFPSLHVGISTTALIFAYRFRRVSRIFYGLWILYVPVTIGLWLSTIYLRHHWVGDIFAGWVVAGLATLLSGWIIRKHSQLWKRLGIRQEANFS